MKHIYLPNRRKKRRIDILPEQSPLNLEDFTARYSEYYAADRNPPKVFNDIEQFRLFLKGLEDKRPLVHNSCIDEHNTVCVHYMVEREHCKVALYGYKMVNN